MSGVSFLRESLLTFGSRILLVLANLPISILVFRHLGAEGQAIYSSATSYATSAVVIGLLGIDAAHTYYLASGRYRTAQIVANAIILLGLITLILMPLFPPLIAFAARGEGDALRPFLTLAAGMIPVVGLRYLLLSIFMARRRIDLFNLFYVGGTLLLLALLVGGFFLFDAGPRWALWAFILSQIAMVAGAAGWVWARELRTGGRLRPSWSLFTGSLSYGLRGFLATVLTTFVYRFDTVLVLRWLGAAAQGHYFIAVFVAEKLTHITASVQAVLFPRISGASREEADRLTPRVCRHTLLWVLAAATGLFAVASPLMRILYSAQAAPSIAPMRILLPGVAALTVAKLLSADLSGRNRRFLPTLFMAASLALNILLNVAWTRRHGIVGAAWASTLAYGLQALLMMLYFWQVTGIGPLRLLLPRREDWDAYRGLARTMRSRASRPSRRPEASEDRRGAGPNGDA